MVLTEAEAEERLAELRRQREAIDRAITDLTLYLELGRRLGGTSGTGPGTGQEAGPASGQGVRHETGQAGSPAGPAAPAPPPAASAEPTSGALATAPGAGPDAVSAQAPRAGPGPAQAGAHVHEGEAGSPQEGAPDRGGAPVQSSGAPAVAPPAASGLRVPAADAARVGADAPGLSEGVLARRYGRALVEAAVAVLEQAGRPLHASEIFSALSERGFSVPGPDPVAALNTRLWKRSGPGGPLRRLGEAVYALGDGDKGLWRFGRL